jgi:hypothetical protein
MSNLWLSGQSDVQPVDFNVPPLWRRAALVSIEVFLLLLSPEVLIVLVCAGG